MVGTDQCVTCGHHKRDHDNPLGCRRCDVAGGHRFLSSKAAELQLAELSNDLNARDEFGQVLPHLEMQARLYALEMAVKSVDLISEITDIEDEVSLQSGADCIVDVAEKFAQFLLVRRYG